MSFYWIKTNKIIKRVFSHQTWDLPNTEKKIYLTFDDGPTPETTEWILAVLKEHQIKATFFCIGNNIQKHPLLFQKIVAEGHTIGNHTYNHLQGWKTDNRKYLENVRLCEMEIKKEMENSQGQPATNILERSAIPQNKVLEETSASNQNIVQQKLFRPPYGKIRPSQSVLLRKKGYKIIMWDVLSADFDHRISPEHCLRNVTKNTSQGSIIVFHDSIKAFRNVEYALPKAIEFLKGKGFHFATID